MRSQSRTIRMWGVTVAGLCVLWFIDPAGAIPLESWDDKIPSAGTRFKVLTEFGGLAVLDKETQLVWERSPLTTQNSWISARRQCTDRITGNRRGWRLPSVHELASLIDPNASNPALPLGHPFNNVQSDHYWSATTVVDFPNFAWFVNFSTGLVLNTFLNKDNDLHAWCVRGGHNHGSDY